MIFWSFVGWVTEFYCWNGIGQKYARPDISQSVRVHLDSSPKRELKTFFKILLVVSSTYKVQYVPQYTFRKMHTISGRHYLSILCLWED